MLESSLYITPSDGKMVLLVGGLGDGEIVTVGTLHVR